MEDFTLTIKDVAKFLKLSDQMVYNLVKDNKIKAFKIGSATRILYSDLTNFIDEQKKEMSKKVNNEYFSVENLEFIIKKSNFSLSNIDLKFPLGKITSIIGPSGSGKTLLLRCIAGLEKINSGKIFLGSKRLDKLETHERKIGFVFQNFALFPNLNLRKNIKFPLMMQSPNKKIIEAETEKRINETNIEQEYVSNLPNTLPEGIKQLTSIAREKNHDIDIFLLDEPMSNLDKNIHTEIRVFLKKFIREFGKTTIITLNNPEDTLTLSDYIAVIDNGRIVQFGETFDVYNNPVSKIVMEETTRLRLNSIDVEVKNGIVQPTGISTAVNDGDYELCFRADEIEIINEGIPVKVFSKQFYDGKRILADCKTEDGVEISLLLPSDTDDNLRFTPLNPRFF